MKIEKTVYVLMKMGDIEFGEETMYLADTDYNFTNDILSAVRSKNKRTAYDVKHEYEICKRIYESDLKIVPLKITYEW